MTASLQGMERWTTAIRHRRLARIAILNCCYLLFMKVLIASSGYGPGFHRISVFHALGDSLTILIPFCWLASAYLINQLACEILPRRSLALFTVAMVGCIPLVQVVPAIYVCYRMRWHWAELGVASAWLAPARRCLKWLKQDGVCFGCGYDIQGNRSGLCPECGSPIATKHLHETSATGLQS